MEITLNKLIDEMENNYKLLVKSHDDPFDEFEAWIRNWYSMAITDLKKFTTNQW